MKNYIEWRPHHWMCMKGYIGISYNKKHANTWDRVYKLLKQYPDTKVKLTMAEDTLCKNCPNNATASGNCNSNFVQKLDKKVRSLLNLKEGGIYHYNKISEKLSEILTPQKHEAICGDCSWREVGLCKDTFKKNS